MSACGEASAPEQHRAVVIWEFTVQKGEGERYKTIQNNTKTGREAKHWGAGSRARMLKVHAAPSFHFLFSPFALSHPHHMHTHTHAHARSQTNTALTPASAVSRCSSAHLQLLLLLHRQCHCPQGCANHNAESTKRAAGLVGYCEQRSHLTLFLLCTRALKRTPQAESHTAMQHCIHDRFCSALLLLSASAITAAPSVPMLLLRRLCTP